MKKSNNKLFGLVCVVGGIVSLVCLLGNVPYVTRHYMPPTTPGYCLNNQQSGSSYPVITFSSSRYPNISNHIRVAQVRGFPRVLRIDRTLASLHRSQALRGFPTRPGFDRDEYPPAMFTEGGTGADVQYVIASENRSSGAWMMSQLSMYANHTCISIRVR